MSTNRYSVYVLKNPQSKLYIGITEDVPRRIEQHNRGDAKWTRGKGPWELLWVQGGLTLSAARKLESKLKRQKGGDGLYRLIGEVRS